MEDEQSILYRRVAMREALRHEVKKLINYYGLEIAQEIFDEELNDRHDGQAPPREHTDYR